MPHSWCPPNRQGHSWYAPNIDDVKVIAAGLDPRAARICKRCGGLGCVSKQGMIRPVEGA